MSTRLVRGWTHLERQRGGGIGLRGPGETQLETDRRLIGKRIKTLNDRLEKVLRAARDDAAGAQARRSADDRAGRLHQRRQVDAVQPPDGRRRLRRRPAVRDARSHRAPPAPGARPRDGARRHRRFRARPAARTGRRVPLDAAGGARGRPAAARDRRGRSRAQRAHRAGQRGARVDRRPATCRRSRSTTRSTAPANRRASESGEDGIIDRVWLSAHSGAGIDLLLQALHQRLGADLCRCVLADPAAGRAGPGPPVCRGCGDLAEDRSTTARSRSRSACVARTSSESVATTASNCHGTTLALCRRRSVSTIQRIAGNPGCGMSADIPTSGDPADQTRISAGAIAPMAWNDPGRNATPGATGPTRARPTSTRSCATCNANCPRCSGAATVVTATAAATTDAAAAAVRRRRDARLRLQHRRARPGRRLGADRLLRRRRRGARRRHALRPVRGHDRAGPALARAVADRGAAGHQRRVDRGRAGPDAHADLRREPRRHQLRRAVPARRARRLRVQRARPGPDAQGSQRERDPRDRSAAASSTSCSSRAARKSPARPRS